MGMKTAVWLLLVMVSSAITVFAVVFAFITEQYTMAVGLLGIISTLLGFLLGYEIGRRNTIGEETRLIS